MSTVTRKRKLPAGMWHRGGVYYARFRRNGREVRKRLSTDLDTAKTLLNELRARADRQDFGLVDNNYRWSDLKAQFIRWAKQSLRCASDYERDIRNLEKYCAIGTVNQIDTHFVMGYREHRLAQLVTPRTVNREIGTLQNMLNRAVAWGKIGSNPISSVKPLRHDSPKKVRRPLTIQEVEAIFREAPEYLRPVLRLFAATGLRRAELTGLLFTDVDFEARGLTIRAELAKNHKAREIPLDDETLAMLEALRDRAKHRQPVEGDTPKQTLQQAKTFTRDHVFVTAANTPVKHNLLRAFYSVCKRAGIVGAKKGGSVDLHSLRVTFTTLALENGASPKAVQAILGHSTLAMTMNVYAKATERSKRDAVGALPFAKMTDPAHVVKFDAVRTERGTANSNAAQVATA